MPTPFSIIIPVYQEAQNIALLIDRIKLLKNCLFEVIFVDDCSEDGTEEIIAELQGVYSWLKLVVRKEARNLSRSVMEGIAIAQYPLLIIMDADLSHPPEKIPAMLKALENPEVDMVIGSRYIAGGNIKEEWPIHRRLISKTAAGLAKMLLPMPISDPLSGFIGIRKQSFNKNNNLNAIGWKLGLEIMVKCHYKNVVEIPILFSERRAGKSKLTAKIAFDYLKQIKQLFFYTYNQRAKK